MVDAGKGVCLPDGWMERSGPDGSPVQKKIILQLSVVPAVDGMRLGALCGPCHLS